MFVIYILSVDTRTLSTNSYQMNEWNSRSKKLQTHKLVFNHLYILFISFVWNTVRGMTDTLDIHT